MNLVVATTIILILTQLLFLTEIGPCIIAKTDLSEVLLISSLFFINNGTPMGSRTPIEGTGILYSIH